MFNKHKATTEQYEAMSTTVTTVFKYCKSFIKLLHDLANAGWNWENNTQGESNRFELFDKGYINALWALSNEIESGSNTAELRAKCEELSRGRLVTGVTVDNVALQTHMNEIFGAIRKKYSGSSTPQMRVADYLNELYAACGELLSNR